MISTVKSWLVKKTKQIMELVEFKSTIEVETITNEGTRTARIVASVRKNVGKFYRPYVECFEMTVKPPNFIERLMDMTMEDKINKASEKLKQRVIRQFKKGKTREQAIYKEIEQRQIEFFGKVVYSVSDKNK